MPITVDQFPQASSSSRGYDAVILANVARGDLGEQRQEDARRRTSTTWAAGC